MTEYQNLLLDVALERHDEPGSAFGIWRPPVRSSAARASLSSLTVAG
jgi:hypothetical protein